MLFKLLVASTAVAATSVSASGLYHQSNSKAQTASQVFQSAAEVVDSKHAAFPRLSDKHVDTHELPMKEKAQVQYPLPKLAVDQQRVPRKQAAAVSLKEARQNLNPNIRKLLQEIDPTTGQTYYPPLGEITSNQDIDILDILAYGPIVATIQESGVTGNDSKSFVDYPLKYDPTTTWNAFFNLPNVNYTTLEGFVNDYFDVAGSDLSETTPTDFQTSPAFLQTIQDPQLRQWGSDVNQLWKILNYKANQSVYDDPSKHTLIPLLHNILTVPGGRFREIYYWDSYWLILGLLVADMTTTATQLTENLLTLCQQFGFIPNGSRRYYLNRSQPPFATLMVDAIYQKTQNDTWLQHWLPVLDVEYKFWMTEGAHAVRVDNTTVLNRYYTNIDYPRPESYTADATTALNYTKFNGLTAPNSNCSLTNITEQSQCALALYDDPGQQVLLSNLAASAESGNDFSSRWFSNLGGSLAADYTRNIIPVDLNAILGKNEELLASYHSYFGNYTAASYYHTQYSNRVAAFDKYLWHANISSWQDYDFVRRIPSNSSVNIITNYIPLWTKPYDACTFNETAVVASLEKSGLILAGGIPVSLIDSTQQWDYPNGWAPHAHMIQQGVASVKTPSFQQQGNYTVCTLQTDAHASELAFSLASKYVYSNYLSYNNSGFMFEKFYTPLIGNGTGGGGEYNPQIGFGWTNGVALVFLTQYGSQLNFTQQINLTAYHQQQADHDGKVYQVLINTYDNVIY